MLSLYNLMEYVMRTVSRLFFAIALLLGMTTQVAYSVCPDCCANMGGIQYCDSSAGRYVCKNGYYSSCYCTRHAVMDMQKIHGCCLWQGGVMLVDPLGLVICNNGGVSETCSLQTTVKTVSIW